MNDNVFCTLFNSGYVDKGLALINSLKKAAPGFRLYVFAMDSRAFDLLRELTPENVVCIDVASLENEEMLAVKKSRSFAEYCWTWTPLTIRHVLERYGEPICTYIDADMYFYSDPATLIAEMREAGKEVMIVKHRFPTRKGQDPEKKYGTFCVEFNTFLNTTPARAVLDEWADDCLRSCSYNKGTETHGDQKYLEEWTAKYDCVHILRNVGGGVAPWNVARYTFSLRDGDIWLTDGETGESDPLCFYHFQNVRYLPFGLLNINVDKRDRFLKERIYRRYLDEIYGIRTALAKDYGVRFSVKKSTYRNPVLRFIQNYVMPFKIKRLSNIMRQKGSASE